MKKYAFDKPMKTTVLTNGKTRCYYNEETRERPVIRPSEDRDAQDSTDDEPETETEYLYDIVDIDGPVNKGTITDALIRNATLTIKEGSTEKQAGPYSQSEVEAIFRHKVAGDAGAAAEFKTFNIFAEACKSVAVGILGENSD